MSGPLTAAEYSSRLLDTVREIRAAERAWDDAIREAAEAERIFKRREAVAMVQVMAMPGAAKSADGRAAQVELLEFEDGKTVGDLRYAMKLAEGKRDAAKKANDHRAAELSALQSWASLSKSEMNFIQTAPGEALGA